MTIRSRLRSYQLTAIISLVFALVGFSYNAWRLEVTEDNNNIRTASFEILITLSELEQLIYSAHYDQDVVRGNPRIGWVKVGLVRDLSGLVSPGVVNSSGQLHQIWSQNWHLMSTSRQATDKVVAAIDELRAEIKLALATLP